MTTQQHSIQKQVLNIHFSSKEDHQRLSEEVKFVFENKTQERISNLFDEIIPADQIVVIDKLKIDLGKISQNGIEEKLPELLLQALEIELRELVEESNINASSKEIQLKNKGKAVGEAFIFFLLSGQWPWWFPLESMGSIENEILKIKDKSFSSTLKKMLVSPKVRERLSLQFSLPFFRHIIERLASNENVSFSEKLDNGSDRISLLKALSSYYNNKITNHTKGETSLKRISTSEQIILDAERKVSEYYKEGIFIKNAGLILIWPYLDCFFYKLSLIEEDQFVSETAKIRAVLLLQFLATGKTEFSESELLLNKILCRLAIDEAVPNEITLAEVERSESDILLLTMIKHWSALKNTSIAGLQETFFQRDGKLSRVDGGWLLQIEEKAVDVLLSHLPWSISMVKLTWMEEMVWVEWGR